MIYHYNFPGKTIVRTRLWWPICSLCLWCLVPAYQPAKKEKEKKKGIIVIASLSMLQYFASGPSYH
jgi:hypothetical protein